MCLERLFQFSRLCIPDPSGVIASAGGHERAVMIEDDAPEKALTIVPLDQRKRLSAVDVPDARAHSVMIRC